MSAAAAISTPIRGRLVAWVILAAFTLAIGALPHLVHFPSPEGAITITQAQFDTDGDNAATSVLLPHSWAPASPYDLSTGRYRLSFQLAEAPTEPLFLLIPAARHTIEAWVNGERTMSAIDTAWSVPTSGYSVLARIPDSALRTGDNEIILRQTREVGWLPARLSEVSVGNAEAVMPIYRLSNFLIEQVRAMSFALHIVLTIGTATIWTARRHDPVFRWLSLTTITSLWVVLTQSPFAPFGALEQFQSTVGMSAVGLMILGLALAIAGWRRPPQLFPAIVIVPLALFAAGQVGWVSFPFIGLISVSIGLLAYLVSAGILAHQFTRFRDWDAAFLAIPCTLMVWFGAHDILVVTGRYDDPFLFSSYVRTLMLLSVMVILMGRLARSLNGLDTANDTLRQRLEAQEAELGRLHEQQREHANQMVREQERERLMRDLHDGVSGHLVTIIALAERNGGSGQAIEQAARAALDDLRLVVHSLDLGDGDLRVALSAFREKVEPQLRRLGIDFEWSTENLPEVSGVTPGNALSILRILQEAITNAVKHGPARRIAIEGKAVEDGKAALHVINDGAHEHPAGTGNGLSNMERRARTLGGSIRFVAGTDGASLSLLLPTALPD